MRVKQFSPFVVATSIVVYLITGLVSLASATVIFSDGFESGNFSAWTDIYGSPNVVSDVKYAGIYGGFVNASGTHTCYYGAYSSPSLGNHLFARGYYKFSPILGDYGLQFVTYITNWGYNGVDNEIADAELAHWTGNDYLWVVRVLDGASQVSGYSSVFALNTTHWYCLELETFVDDFAGYANLYVDDVLVATVTGVSNDLFGEPNHIGFGQQSDIRNGEPVWWDCCVIADSHIGLELPPMPVTLNQATDITESSLRLSWTESSDIDFKNYTIYQSSALGSLGNAVHTITDKLTTSFILTGLSANTSYYFTIRVYDTGGLYADSNQMDAKTNAAQITPNFSPIPVTLYQATDITQNSLKLSWTENTDVDFKNYTVYLSTVTGTVRMALTAITSSALTSYNVTGLAANTTYYFMIRVYDTEGFYADSNQISATTSSASSETLQFPLVPVIGGTAVAAIVIILIAWYIKKRDRNSIHTRACACLCTVSHGHA